MHFSGKIDRTWASDKSGLGLDDCILTRKFSRLGDHEPPAPPAIRNARARTEVVLSPPSFFFSVFNHTPQNRENIHFPAYQFFFHLLNDFHRSFLSPRSSSSLPLVVPEEIIPLQRSFDPVLDRSPWILVRFTPPLASSHRVARNRVLFSPLCVRGTRCERSNPIGAQLRSDFDQDRSPLSPFRKISSPGRKGRK